MEDSEFWRSFKTHGRRRQDCKFRDKLKHVKQDLKVWSKNIFGKTDMVIQNHKQEAQTWECIAEVQNLHDDEMRQWKEARNETVEKERYKSQMSRQKARMK